MRCLAKFFVVLSVCCVVFSISAMDLGIRIAMWSRTAHKIVEEVLPSVSLDAAPTVVTNAIVAAGFADMEAVKTAIGGSAAEYNAFKVWASSVKGAGGVSAEAAGEAVVVANTNAAAAYLLGAERLFENSPKVEFGGVAVGAKETGGIEGTGPEISVAVTVRDGEEVVKCAAGKVAAMFEATSDLGNWNGAARLTPTVTVGEGDGATMYFTVTLDTGTKQKAFLRIRK